MTEPSPGTGCKAAGGPHGVVLLDKPVGWSSNRALQRVRRLYGTRKGGHTGSLDPLASGMLPICLGQATRFSGYLLDAPKSYRVTGELGARTTTGDREGEVVERCPWSALERPGFSAVLRRFRGRIRQVPPMYSALKQDGERLYRKARRGETVARAPREVEIYHLALEDWDPPAFTLDVRCSKGTYMRTLVEDVAQAGGSCAHVTALRRYAAGPFTEDQMYTLAALEALAAAGGQRLADALLPADSALAGMSAVELAAPEARRLAQGQVLQHEAGAAGLVRLYAAGGFLGLGQRDAAGRLRAKRLLDTADMELRLGS